MTAVEVSLFGGWRSPWTPLHYKHNSLMFKREMSKKFHSGEKQSKIDQQIYSNEGVPGPSTSQVTSTNDPEEDEREEAVLVLDSGKRRKN